MSKKRKSENTIYSAKNKVPVLVDRSNGICPRCYCATHPVSIKIMGYSSIFKLHVRQCHYCSDFVIPYSILNENKSYLKCLNPKHVRDIEESFIAESIGPERASQNAPVHSSIISIPKTIFPREKIYCEFELFDSVKKHAIAVSIKDIGKSTMEINQWVLSTKSRRGIDCMKAVANNEGTIQFGNITYSIGKLQVYDAQYIKRYETASYGNKTVYTNTAGKMIDVADDSVDVYVYYRLSNSCIGQKHPIENVTLRSISSNSGRPCLVNAFYCTMCHKYFINHEAVKALIGRKIYPSFHYIQANDFENRMKPVSQLMMYGYSARADGPSSVVRHGILKWVVDTGLMSKTDIIKDLQFKITYNGKKAGNESAKAKWEEDLEFLNSYVAHNKRVITGNLKRG